MENASKALLIAGGVLIAILVMTVGVYFSRMIADHSARVYAQLEESRRTEFNQKFLNYDVNHRKKDGSSNIDLTIQDVVTIANLAQNSNKYNQLENVTPPADPTNDKSLYVTVNCIRVSDGKLNELYDSVKKNLEKLNEDKLNSILMEELKEMPQDDSSRVKYSCTVKINQNTGYVNYIEITN